MIVLRGYRGAFRHSAGDCPGRRQQTRPFPLPGPLFVPQRRRDVSTAPAAVQAARRCTTAARLARCLARRRASGPSRPTCEAGKAAPLGALACGDAAVVCVCGNPKGEQAACPTSLPGAYQGGPCPTEWAPPGLSQ